MTGDDSVGNSQKRHRYICGYRGDCDPENVAVYGLIRDHGKKCEDESKSFADAKLIVNFTD